MERLEKRTNQKICFRWKIVILILSVIYRLLNTPNTLWFSKDFSLQIGCFSTFWVDMSLRIWQKSAKSAKIYLREN